MLNDIKSLLIECMQHGQIDESNDQLTDCWIFEGDLGEAASQLSLNESELDEDILGEAAGALAGLPSHIIKHMAHRYASGGKQAGENSPTEVHPVKAKTAAHVAITDALNKGHHVVVKKDGKVLASVHSYDTGGRPVNSVVKADGDGGKVKQETTKFNRTVRGGKVNVYRHTYERSDLTRAEAINHVHKMVDEHGGYKGGNVEIHTIGVDKNRVALQKERGTNRGEYVKNLSGNGGVRNDGRGKASDEKSLAAVTKRAAERIANKYSSEAGPKSKALDIHAKMGEAIKNGDHKAVRQHMEALANHMHNSGLSADSYDKSRVIDAGEDMGERGGQRGKNEKYNWRRDDFVRGVRKLKGEKD